MHHLEKYLNATQSYCQFGMTNDFFSQAKWLWVLDVLKQLKVTDLLSKTEVLAANLFTKIDFFYAINQSTLAIAGQLTYLPYTLNQMNRNTECKKRSVKLSKKKNSSAIQIY